MPSVNVRCPWCEETFDVNVDMATIEGDFCEECPLCGFPMKLVVQRDAAGNAVGLGVRPDEED
jgi:hypothetical protein